MTTKYNSRDAEVEPKTENSEEIEAAMIEDGKEEGTNGVEI